MGNKWSRSEEELNFIKNPYKYIEANSVEPEYTVSLGSKVTLQRRNFAEVKNPRFESTCFVEQSASITLLKTAQEMLHDPDVINTEDHVKNVLTENTKKILATISLDLPDQYLEVIHGRYWGLAVRNTIADLIAVHTSLEVQRIISCGRNRIWHECLHLREPQLYKNKAGSFFNRRQLLSKPAVTIAQYFRETTPVE